MKIEQRKIDSIKPYGKNAKKHPEKQVIQIAESIEAFGFNQPIVIDKDGIIIVGHGRYYAADYLGFPEVPTLTVDISEEKAKAYRLADNKLNESDWDMDLAISELKDMSLEMLDLTGFDRSLALDNNDKDDVVPDVPEIAKSKLGDVYKLGKHIILCGDSTKEESFKKLMGEVKADMVFTDPPYNVNYSGKGKKTSKKLLNDTFKQIKDNIKAGGGLYIFHSSSSQIIFEEAMAQNGIEVKNQLIWNKPVASMGWGDYRWKHEPFFYANIKGSPTNFYGDRTHTTILDFQKTDAQLAAWAKRQKKAEKDGKTTIWSMKRDPVQDYVHPTQKPVELITYALHNSSKVEDIVLDPFLGSGSTIISCEKTNRICYGIELDPLFIDVIVQRWEDYTEQEAIKL